jgi:hypothetical protein
MCPRLDKAGRVSSRLDRIEVARERCNEVLGVSFFVLPDRFAWA